MFAKSPDPVSEFNLILQSLIEKVESKCTNELERSNVDRIRKRMALARDVLGRDVIIKKSGPTLVKYKDEIIKGNDSFFLKLEVSEVNDKLESDYDFVHEFVSNVKKSFQSFDETEKDEIRLNLKSLLREYLKFILSEKTRAKK